MARQDTYTALATAPDNADLVNIVDVSDTTQNAAGTTKVQTITNFFANLLNRTTGGTMLGALTLGTGASIIGADKVVSAVELRDVSETAFSAGTKQGAATFNYTDGGYQFCTIGTADITSMAISNPPPSGTLGSLTIEFTQHATTPRTITWGAVFRFPGGTDFTLTATANAVDIVTLVTRDAGTTWRVFEGAKNFAA